MQNLENVAIIIPNTIIYLTKRSSLRKKSSVEKTREISSHQCSDTFCILTSSGNGHELSENPKKELKAFLGKDVFNTHRTLLLPGFTMCSNSDQLVDSKKPQLLYLDSHAFLSHRSFTSNMLNKPPTHHLYKGLAHDFWGCLFKSCFLVSEGSDMFSSPHLSM